MGSVKLKRKLLDYIKDNAKDNLFTVSTKKDISEALGSTVPTINKHLKVLEEEKEVVVVTKPGRNGGVIITVLENIHTSEEFKEFKNSSDDIITSTKKYAEELRDKHFPTYKYQRKEVRRRTKKEMLEYNAIKDEKRRTILDMNLALSTSPYPTKEIFNMSYDPEGFFKAYILCKLYDQYCISHMYAKHVTHKQLSNDYTLKPEEMTRHSELSKYYYQQFVMLLPRNSASEEFFGSRNFNTFYNFYIKVKDRKDFNIFKYIQNVFKNVSFSYENGYYKNPIPAPNYFSSDKYLQSYDNYIKGIKKGVNKTNRHLGAVEGLISSKDYTNNPALTQLQQLYIVGLNNEVHDIEEMFKHALDLEEVEFGYIRDVKHLTLLNFSNKVDKAIQEFEEQDKEIMNKFVKQLIINEYAPTSFPKTAHVSMFPMQRHHMVSELRYENKSIKDNALNISLVSNNPDTELLDKQDLLNLTQVAYDYLTMSKYNSNYYVIRMFADFMGYEVNLRDVKRIIEKYSIEDLIPLTKYGMLDYDKIKRENEGVKHE